MKYINKNYHSLTSCLKIYFYAAMYQKFQYNRQQYSQLLNITSFMNYTYYEIT